MAPMQRLDASVSATSATGYESVPSGSEAIVLVEANVEQDMFAAGVATLFMAGVPAGLDLACTDDPELFFAEAPEDVEAAKALCQGCRARAACLEGALERREPWGVWGGELILRGVIVPRKRPRGRPRKVSADEQAA
jgi:WhiB family transcriptional regulator, redox-sensing transcriptional regulator